MSRRNPETMGPTRAARTHDALGGEEVQRAHEQPPDRRRLRLNRALLAPAGVVALGLGLRLWGARHGLPYVDNVDEEFHYVPPAAHVLMGSFHPESFINPPALTYLLSVVYVVVYGGRDAALHEWNLHPEDLYLLGRIVVACIGTIGVWLVYMAGSRLFGRLAGLVASAAIAVAFLPVFYSHHALNDVPAVSAVALSLFGAAGILRRGRPFDYALAGAAAGLAAATKYPSGIVLLSLVAAGGVRALEAPERRRALAGVGLGLGAALVAFFLADPFAFLDFSGLRGDLEFLSRVNGGHFIGLPYENGYTYYPWTFTWGLGWVPALAALAGAFMLAWREPRAALILLPTGIVYFLFVASYAPYGRYLLPAFPIACLLAGYCVSELVQFAGRRRPALGRPAAVVAVGAVMAQGLLYSVHNDLVLSRTDTRTLARDWLLAHVPAGATIVLEPAMSRDWTPAVARARRWRNYPTARAYWEVTGDPEVTERGKRRRTGALGRSKYVLHLRPQFVDLYRRDGACWVVTASTQSGRAFAEPARAPGAIAYYARLEREADVAFRASPYAPGAGPVPFSYDFTFDYYPLVYHRPGPELTVYRLRGGRCS